MKNFLLLLIISALQFACSSNKDSDYSEELLINQTNNSIIPLELPNWFTRFPPEETLAVGIAATNPYEPELTDDKIKENAAIIASRNKSAIVIAKLKMRENQQVLTPTLSEFRLQLANDIPDLKSYFANSKVLQTSPLYGMTIGIVGLSDDNIKLDTLTQLVTEPPTWFTDNVIDARDNCLISSGKSTAVNLATAYKNAYNEAVYNLIAGIKPQVKSSIINSQNYLEKFVEIDASLIIENMRITRNSLLLRKCGNAHVYDAYVQLSWQPMFSFQDVNIKE